MTCVSSLNNKWTGNILSGGPSPMRGGRNLENQPFVKTNHNFCRSANV